MNLQKVKLNKYYNNFNNIVIHYKQKLKQYKIILN